MAALTGSETAAGTELTDIAAESFDPAADVTPYEVPVDA
jgi:hypothetical protein